MTKIVTMSPTARQELIKGVDILANAVKVTLGPKGRHVIVENEHQKPSVTKDGVTVAKAIKLADPVQNLGAELLKGAAKTAVAVCGDGTTTATVLAQELLTNANNLISKGYSPVDIKRAYEDLTKMAVEIINKSAKLLNYDSTELQQVASIAANNDYELGTLIADAVSRAKDTGIVLVEESKSTETYLEKIDGCRIDRGFTSAYFINNTNKQSCILEKPFIFITDKKLSQVEDILPIMEAAASRRKPLVVIAEEIEPICLTQMVYNKINGQFPCLAVKAPAYGERRTSILQDLALLSGATYFCEAKGDSIANFTIDDFGTMDKVISTVANTTFVGSQVSPEALEERLAEIRAEIEDSENDWYRSMHKQRLANLTGTISVIYVGAQTEAELEERKYRLDDSLQATQAATKNGIVPGAGMALYHTAKAIKVIKSDTGVDNIREAEFNEAFYDALTSPFKTILTNGGYDPQTVQLHIEKRTEDFPLEAYQQGFNSLTGDYCDLYEQGIIDPALVVTSALEAASSVACILLLTDATVTPEKTQESIYPMGAPPPGYQGM